MCAFRLIFAVVVLLLCRGFIRADEDSGYWDTRFTLNSDQWPASATFDTRGRIVAAGNAPFVFPSADLGIVRWDGRGWKTMITNRLSGAGAIRLAHGPGFTVAGGVPRTNQVMRLDDDSATELPEAVTGRISSVAVAGGEIIAGGEFTTPNGSLNVARWNGAQWSPLGSGVPGQVTQLLSADGQLYAATPGVSGGAAATVWQWDGGAWVQLGEVAPGGTAITALCRHENILTVGINAGAEADCIRQWRNQQWQAPPGEPLQGPGVSLAVCRGELWAAGQLKVIGAGGTESAAVARWHEGRWEPQLRDEITRGRFVESDGERLLLKADFNPKTTYGLAFSAGLWFLEGSTWRLLINGLFSAPNTLAAAAAPDGVVVTTDVADRHLRGSFLWDGTRCRPLPTPPGTAGEQLRMKAGLVSVGGAVYGGASYPAGANPHVLLRRTAGPWTQASTGTAVEPQVLASDGTRIFAAGKSTDPAFSPQSVVVWTGTGWQPVGAPFDRPILALEYWNNQLIAAGSFTNAGQAGVSWLARWDGTAWNPLGPPLNGEVRSLHWFQNELYVAGKFSRAGELEVPGLAIWNGSAWRTLPAAPNLGNLAAVAVSHDGRVAVIGAGSLQRIWIWRGAEWTLVSDNRPGAALPRLLWLGNDLHVTGGFVELGGLVSDVFGIWHEPGPRLQLMPGPGSGVAVTVSGALPVHYQLERSTNFSNWLPWATNSPLAHEQTFIVPPDGVADSGVYFRLRAQP